VDEGDRGGAYATVFEVKKTASSGPRAFPVFLAMAQRA
jgi:hypothetical protein